MKEYTQLSRTELEEELAALKKQYEEFKELGLSLDMTRGKPSPAQLDMTDSLFDGLCEDTHFRAADGSDCRNYCCPTGLKEAKELFAGILKTDPDRIFIGNSSSLNLMFDALMRAMVFGEHDSDAPWSAVEGRKWLCVVPGYDRHFRITEKLGFELVNVPIRDDGPDMDLVEELVLDEKVKGMWCVPCYSNPDGVVYSEEVCRRLASMKTGAKDFRIFWDNAYCVHHLYDDVQGSVPDILAIAEECGNPSRFYEFASTSKITFAGAGLACFATNGENMAHAKPIIGAQTICSDKVNQLAHVHFLKDVSGVRTQMSHHAAILRPKFEAALSILDTELTGLGIADWRKPLGGYFISVFVYPGTADRVVSLCKDLGVAFTPAGATYPYGKDPDNSNIRLAPSFPAIGDIEKAVKVFALCVKIAALEKISA